MSWCERQGLYYCFGFGRNEALIKRMESALVDARAAHCLNGAAKVRRFRDFEYRTCKSWSRLRRVVGKAEVNSSAEDMRFVVHNLPVRGFTDDTDLRDFTAERVYEELYCARGEMENVLKQQVLDLKADRMSTHYLASNQLRLWLAALAYLLLERVRTIGCRQTQLARATAATLRLKILKVAALVNISVRRVYVQLSSAYPLQNLFRLCHSRLMHGETGSG